MFQMATAANPGGGPISYVTHCRVLDVVDPKAVWAQNRAIAYEPTLHRLFEARLAMDLWCHTVRLLYEYHIKFNDDFGGGFRCVVALAGTTDPLCSARAKAGCLLAADEKQPHTDACRSCRYSTFALSLLPSFVAKPSDEEWKVATSKAHQLFGRPLKPPAAAAAAPAGSGPRLPWFNAMSPEGKLMPQAWQVNTTRVQLTSSYPFSEMERNKTLLLINQNERWLNMGLTSSSMVPVWKTMCEFVARYGFYLTKAFFGTAIPKMLPKPSEAEIASMEFCAVGKDCYRCHLAHLFYRIAAVMMDAIELRAYSTILTPFAKAVFHRIRPDEPPNEATLHEEQLPVPVVPPLSAFLDTNRSPPVPSVDDKAMPDPPDPRTPKRRPDPATDGADDDDDGAEAKKKPKKKKKDKDKEKEKKPRKRPRVIRTDEDGEGEDGADTKDLEREGGSPVAQPGDRSIVVDGDAGMKDAPATRDQVEEFYLENLPATGDPFRVTNDMLRTQFPTTKDEIFEAVRQQVVRQFMDTLLVNRTLIPVSKLQDPWDVQQRALIADAKTFDDLKTVLDRVRSQAGATFRGACMIGSAIMQGHTKFGVAPRAADWKIEDPVGKSAFVLYYCAFMMQQTAPLFERLDDDVHPLFSILKLVPKGPLSGSGLLARFRDMKTSDPDTFRSLWEVDAAVPMTDA